MMHNASPGSLSGLAASYGEAPYDIHIEVKSIGKDILVFVYGGTHSHIGAVALAEPAGALHPVTGEPACTCGEGRGTDEAFRKPGGSPQVSVLKAYGHKDALLAEMFARGLCEKYGVNVCASAGVHVDGASAEEISLMVGNANTLLEMILSDWP